VAAPNDDSAAAAFIFQRKDYNLYWSVTLKLRPVVGEL
jgi:hypothetical protein